MNPMPPPPDMHDQRLRSVGRTLVITALTIVGVVVLAYVAFFILMFVSLSNSGSNK